MDCQRGDFGLFRILVGRVPCEAVLKESRKAGHSSRKKSYRHRSRLKDRVLWKKTSLTELRALAGTQEIKEINFSALKEGAEIQQDYQDVMRLCRGILKALKDKQNLKDNRNGSRNTSGIRAESLFLIGCMGKQSDKG